MLPVKALHEVFVCQRRLNVGQAGERASKRFDLLEIKSLRRSQLQALGMRLPEAVECCGCQGESGCSRQGIAPCHVSHRTLVPVLAATPGRLRAPATRAASPPLSRLAL